jgi:hypothetical protein
VAAAVAANAALAVAVVVVSPAAVMRVKKLVAAASVAEKA